MNSFNIAFMASGGGSNMQAIIDNCINGELVSKPKLLLVHNKSIGAVEKANIYGLEVEILPLGLEEESLAKLIIEQLERYEINLLCLAGYLKKLPVQVIKHLNSQVLNIHPSLLPKFGGKGMYGINVHKAVIESGENVSGCTVHQVSENYDEGKIFGQLQVDINLKDTPDLLASKVLKHEHILYTQVIKKLELGEFSF